MQPPEHRSFNWSHCTLYRGARLAFCRAKFIGKVLKCSYICIYLRVDFVTLFCTFCTKVPPRFCAELQPCWNSCCQPGAWGPAVQVTTQPCPLHAWGTCHTLGSAGRRATVLLAPSLNSAATQQEFHFYFVSESISRPKARMQNVLWAHSCLFWVDFLAVSFIGMLITASFSNTH